VHQCERGAATFTARRKQVYVPVTVSKERRVCLPVRHMGRQESSMQHTAKSPAGLGLFLADGSELVTVGRERQGAAGSRETTSSLQCASPQTVLV
jgi:hypothetical protein